jgi:hypothetical protein
MHAGVLVGRGVRNKVRQTLMNVLRISIQKQYVTTSAAKSALRAQDKNGAEKGEFCWQALTDEDEPDGAGGH